MAIAAKRRRGYSSAPCAQPRWFGLGGVAPVGALRFRGSLMHAGELSVIIRCPPDRSNPPSSSAINPYILLLAAGGNAECNPLGQFSVVYAVMVDSRPERVRSARVSSSNGDSIYTTTTGQMSETGNATVKSIIEFHTVTGGTGYYTGAAGSFTVNRLLTFAPDGLTGRSEGSFNGLIHVIFQPPGL